MPYPDKNLWIIDEKNSNELWVLADSSTVSLLINRYFPFLVPNSIDNDKFVEVSNELLEDADKYITIKSVNF